MRRETLHEEHMERLAAYGLGEVPAERFQCLYYESGETIQQEGAPVERLLILHSGRAKVCAAAPNGRNLVLCYYLSNGMIGDIELMTGEEQATASVIAVTPVTCIAVPLGSGGVDLRSNAGFLNVLGRELAEKLARSSRSHASAALYTGEERLCAYLLQSADRGLFTDPITDTACSVGMSYRHTIRILQGLCRDGLLEKRNSGYWITDRVVLARRAGGLAEEDI